MSNWSPQWLSSGCTAHESENERHPCDPSIFHRHNVMANAILQKVDEEALR
jgi:hypothetical protein